MAEAMNVCCDKDGIPYKPLHGLRMLDPEIFTRFPFASADSTNVARNIKYDKRWDHAYSPKSKKIRALVLIDRIESYNSAPLWDSQTPIQNDLIF